MKREAEIIVVGAGHAGCEAAFAAARMECKTFLITSQADTLGLMPCNPAVGGLAKSHLVAELDALGGEMGFNADLTGLQYRMLNQSRGPAVRAVRVQCDKAKYTQRLARIAQHLPHLTVIEATVSDLLLEEKARDTASSSQQSQPHTSSYSEIQASESTSSDTSASMKIPCGVVTTTGEIFYARQIILTSGTALGGRIWVGHNGRDGAGDARPALPLPATLQSLSPDLQWRRLKTGTPPRLWNKSIDWDKLQLQCGETAPVPFFSRRMRLLQDDVLRGTSEIEKRVPRGTSDFDGEKVPRGTFTFPNEGSPIWQLLDGYATYRLLRNHTSAADTCHITAENTSFVSSISDEANEVTSGPIGTGGASTHCSPGLGGSPSVITSIECDITHHFNNEFPSLFSDEMFDALEAAQQRQMACWFTHTTTEGHQIILDNLSESAMYGGEISGEGVRYCPSIEDKIVKFGDRGGHHVIIEPEGRDCPWCYPNGLSNSLPADVQLALIRSVPGLENAEMAAPGYAIEYDCIDPCCLDARLALKDAPNLFFAGQINGTTGYEEAAAQGFLAGVNAALAVKGEPPLTFFRDEAYIGVMVDDLITKGTDEPYRMFTSRAERRLLLRPNDAHIRLHAFAKRLGIVAPALLDLTEREMAWLATTEAQWKSAYLDGNGTSRWKYLARDGITFDCAAAVTRLDKPSEEVQPDAIIEPLSAETADGTTLPKDWIEELELRAKYEGYIAHERDQAEKLKKDAKLRIPLDFDYAAIRGLRFEAREKLMRVRPDSLLRSSGIPGVNPADIALLAIALKK